MRLFTGLALPKEIIDHLSRLVEHLRSTAHVKWSPPYNLHITTKFIGEWPEDRLRDLRDALAQVPAPDPFEIRVGGFGWFPNPHNPRVLWVGVHAPPELEALAVATDKAVAALGIPSEARAFSPHLTLARLKEPVPLVLLQRAIADLRSDQFGSYKPKCFYLYRSTPGPSSSIYTQLAEFPLHKQ